MIAASRDVPFLFDARVGLTLTPNARLQLGDFENYMEVLNLEAAEVCAAAAEAAARAAPSSTPPGASI